MEKFSILSIGADKKPNTQIAIDVNNELKKQLIDFSSKLKDLREQIEKRLKSLDEFLNDNKSNEREKDPINYKTSYVKCGAPFFKDAHGYPAPENDDYKYRKNVLKEFFPFDIPSAIPAWTEDEKNKLLKGVKNQMIDYIKIQQSKKLCQDSKKTRGRLQKLRFISNSKDLHEMPLLNIFETIQREHLDFKINWNLISFNDLLSVHSVAECMGMWYSYLKPDIKNEPFTEEENAILSIAVVENKYENWDLIAKQLTRRSSLQAFTYFHSEASRICPPNVRWTPDEDQLLLNAVKKNTHGNNTCWSKIGSSFDNRNKTQCYNRYLILTRHQNTRKGVFTLQENRILLNYVAQFGTDFNKMPRELMPNRSLVQIKNHYSVALKHKGKVNPWTFEEDKKLMDFVEKKGTDSWHKVAEILSTHNRLSCRTRYITIMKFLTKNPNKSLKDVPSRLKKITSVHKAVQSEDDDDESRAYSDKTFRSKTFGKLTFEDFKLRNPQLFSLLKTAYNYNLCVREINIDIPKFLALKQLLDIDDCAIGQKFTYMFTKNQTQKLKEAISFQQEDSVQFEIRSLLQTKDVLLPPSFNTAIGLRAIAIKIQEDPIEEMVNDEDESEEYIKSAEVFRKLFMSLFYWPAMMSKLQEPELRSNYLIKDSKNNMIKIVNYVTNEGSSGSFGISLKRSANHKNALSSKKARN